MTAIKATIALAGKIGATGLEVVRPIGAIGERSVVPPERQEATRAEERERQRAQVVVVDRAESAESFPEIAGPDRVAVETIAEDRGVKAATVVIADRASSTAVKVDMAGREVTAAEVDRIVVHTTVRTTR